MTRYGALSRVLEIVLTLKRVTSDQLRNQMPVPGAGQEYQVWEDLAETIREMMRDARFGDGKSPKCAEQSETAGPESARIVELGDHESTQIIELLNLCDEAQARAKRIMETMEDNPGHWPRDAWEDIAQVESYMEDAQHCLMDAADLHI